ncbi:Colicin I receptor precursor [Tsuneonella dongtanensis]|uniref:Colicin I receptor n=1 Tax=Tsuneonella dongtanensis TaxID=692370 RepID=A0A1B2AFN9_9SPHN|nr:TonB-dependent receptor [Tsuneonella dongtanensis]ANY20960.1 Colicin I receptor precursor [Tsuneonella dongtanensis]
MRLFNHLRLALFSTTAVSSFAFAPAVLAQDAGVAENNASTEGTIVVTGTRVVRDGFEAPTPVQVLTEEDIENSSPTNNIADFVNQLPALAASIRPSNSRLELSNGQAGINALNLRSLGTVRTLVLVNGRRSVGSTANGIVDVNTIPQSLVQRVEVVTGGASAAYGSDAVAGVTNFILNNEYEGIKVGADAGITHRGDGFNYSADATAGFAFADGRARLIVAGEIAHTDGIFSIDPIERAWNHQGFVRITNPAWSANATVPRYLFRTMVGAANSTPGGLITGSSGGTPLCGTYFGQGGSINQYQYGSLVFPSPACSSTPSLNQGGDWRVNDSGRRIGLSPEEDRWGVFGRLSFDITDGVRLFGEASFNRQETLFNAGPNLMTGLSIRASNCGTGATAPISCNAFLYRTLGSAALAGRNTVTLATTAADLPGRGTNNERKVERYTIGAEGDFEAFGRPAQWDIYGQYGRADLHEQLINIQQTTRRNVAIDAVFAPAGNESGLPVGSIQCRINVDGDTTNNDAACRPLNLLGLGVSSADAIDYVLGDPYRDQFLKQTVAGANLSLNPFATWAGDVSIAVGAEYRKEEIDGFVPQEFQPVVNANGSTTSLWSVGNYRPSKGSYNVKEAYLETVIPLGFGLDFNGAIRGTDYSTSGFVTTWKLGATWQPIDDILLRANRSRDIRAPNLNELFQAGTANTSTVTNPYFVAGQMNPGPGTGIYGPSLSYLGTVTGNLNLRPEKADSYSFGAVLTPRFVPGLSFSADYWRVKVTDAIDSLSADDIVNRCFEGLADYCAAITPDPNVAGRVLISRSPFNFASILIRGIDFEAAYRASLGAGNLNIRGLATRYLENTVTTGVPGFTPFDSVGTLGIGTGSQSIVPKWIYRVSAAYDTDDYTLTAVARGVGDGRYDATGIECGSSGCPVSTNQFPTYEDNSIDGVTYVDFNATFKFDAFGGKNGEFFVNVTNLFDTDPIVLPETGLAANSTYSDLLGRAYRVGVRLKLR